MGFLKALLAKATAGWTGYAATAVVATGITAGSIVLLADSGVINLTSGLGQRINLPFTFKPAALGNLDQIYGSITAGASQALTGVGIQLPQLAVTNKIAAVSSKIVAEAAADKASLRRLADAAQKLQGFKQSEDAQKVVDAAIGTTTPTPLGGSTPVGTATPVGTLTPVAGTSTPTRTQTPVLTPTPTQTPTQLVTPTATGTGTVTPTATIAATETATVTPTATCTPAIVGGVCDTPTPTATPTATSTSTPSAGFPSSGQALIACSNMTPGGQGVSVGFNLSNSGAHPITFRVSTSLTSATNLLWTDTTNGMQVAIDRGGTRDVTNPQAVPGGNSNVYTGAVSGVSNVLVATGAPPGQTIGASITCWLPSGPPLPANYLTPNPGNDFQGLSITVRLDWTASE